MSENENTVVEYWHNNSGGSDWLTDADWAALEAAGWVPGERNYRGRPFGATRTGLSFDAAVAEWESITGQDSRVEGCPCCGQPHSFYPG